VDGLWPANIANKNNAGSLFYSLIPPLYLN